MDRIKRFFEQCWLYYNGSNAHIDWEELIFYRIAIPLITLVYYCFIAKHSFRTEQLTKWVIGNSMLLCNNSCVFTIGATFEGERYYGRLKWLIVSPYSRIATVIQKGFFFIFESIATVILCITFGSLLFGVDFTNVNLGLFIIIMLTGIIAAVCFGLFLSIFPLLFDSMNLILNLVHVCMLILCGANFPVKDLPKAVRFISYCLPFTRSIEAANMLFGEFNKYRLLTLLGQELCVGIVYLILGVILLKIIEKIAIHKATLEIF